VAYGRIPMLIGIDGIPLKDIKTGVGHYTFELAKSLALATPKDQLEIVSPFSFLPLDQSEDVRDVLPPNLLTTQVKVNLLERNWWTVGLPRYIKRRSIDLFHGTNFDIPLWKVCPTVLTVHDLSAFVYPETHEARSVRRARRRLPLMARTATQIVTHSESVRREVADYLGVSFEKVIAIPAAARSIFRPLPPGQTAEARKRLGVEDEFLLYAGTIEPRKNLIVLLNAYREVLSATELHPQLVIAGKKGWLTDEFFGRLRELGIQDRVHFTGYLSDNDLCALYSSCRIFIYPSIYEGFGLPPLEAMACGAPVIASTTPSIMEVLGNAACLVAPKASNKLANAIITLLREENERRRLTAAGLKRAQQFSWNRTAQLMLGVYHEACERYRREGN
jgi:glycosyltransferase involved in cell wall biosynthesis